jgi:hypothetical protein
VLSHIDVLLYDTFGRERIDETLEKVLAESDAKVVLYTWSLQPELIAEGTALGIKGFLSKTLDAVELVEAIEKVHFGLIVVDPPLPDEAPIVRGAWPGREHGLTPASPKCSRSSPKGCRTSKSPTELSSASTPSRATSGRHTARSVSAAAVRPLCGRSIMVWLPTRPHHSRSRSPALTVHGRPPGGWSEAPPINFLTRSRGRHKAHRSQRPAVTHQVGGRALLSVDNREEAMPAPTWELTGHRSSEGIHEESTGRDRDRCSGPVCRTGRDRRPTSVDRWAWGLPWCVSSEVTGGW